jgi:transcriptional regulator with XRE-family HTH domain
MNNFATPTWSLADRLRKAREQAGLDQRELAERARIARGTISAAENGKRRPSGAVIGMWAMVTGVSRGWLTGDDGSIVDPELALDEIRLTALIAVVGAAARPERGGHEQAQAVLDAVARRESEVQAAGDWEASSKLDHPEVLAWCEKYQPWTADELGVATARLADR